MANGGFKIDQKDMKKLTTAAGAPVANNQNSMTAGKRGPILLQDVWYLENLHTLTEK